MPFFRRETRVVFVIAQTEPYFQHKLKDESESFEDILQFPVPEQYLKIVAKSISLFDWSVQSCPQAVLTAKFDTDTFSNVDSIIRGLNSIITRVEVRKFYPNIELPVNISEYFTILATLPAMFGLRRNSCPHDPDALSVPPSRCCGKKMYPDYLSGGFGYILTRAAAVEIKKVYNCCRQYYLEDLWVTGFLPDYSPIPIPRIHLIGYILEMRHSPLEIWRTIEEYGLTLLGIQKSSQEQIISFVNASNPEVLHKYFLLNTGHWKKIFHKFACLWHKIGTRTIFYTYIDMNRPYFSKGTPLMKLFSQIIKLPSC